MINKITIILRNFDIESAKLIAHEADQYDCFSLEIALNSANAFDEIKAIKDMHQKNVMVGAGTVVNMELLKQAKEAGAEFVLAPICMTEEMIQYCKENNMISVPGAYSPSEIQQMKVFGADVVKVFPASSVGPSYFEAIMAPLGHIPMMVVGGINAGNVNDYFSAGIDYAGIGSGICNKEELMNGNISSLVENLKHLNEIAKGSAD